MWVSLCVDVKLHGRPLAATSVAGPSPQGRLFHIRDRSSSLRFLVDTGAQVSIVPPSRAERSTGKRNVRLQAINGSEIATFGVRSLTLDIGLGRSFPWVFVIADIPQPILGADFLYHFGLLVDLRHSKLVDSATQLQVQGIVCPDQSSTGLTRLRNEDTNPYIQLLAEFPAVT